LRSIGSQISRITSRALIILDPDDGPVRPFEIVDRRALAEEFRI
jgi:hypothetical protein